VDNELLLFDRLNVIKDTINSYGADNFYLSFSGGKDSTVLHHLLDMALPSNTIPRVFCNTGIEYLDIVRFVKSLATTDQRIHIIQPGINIKKMLTEKGYPFKSKMYAQQYQVFKRNEKECKQYISQCENQPELINDYDFIHNLPKGIKTVVKQYFGKREREKNLYEYGTGYP
jgi:3'-phosphoadenosine 5'-phosphosulfate sulfotransferase (PAPS reductase)/FAD synthetase